MQRRIIAGALGNCVHVAGVVSFLRVAEGAEYKTEFLGAAVSIDDFVEAVRRHDPEIVGVSYRLTPEVAGTLLIELREKLEREGLADRRFVFGGTPPVCEVAEKLGWFERCFTGLENRDAILSYLRGDAGSSEAENYDDTLLERLERKHPYPILRHHFGLPSLEDTIAGVRKIAESGVLDVISIAPDQNAQESMFRPDEMDSRLDGAGGAPIRSADDLGRIHEASRCGNYPLLRIYSGTRDLTRWAELATETIHNAWAAIPLCWFSALDGRSKRPLKAAIRENQEAMRWYGERGIPVEVNEAHHWSMRDAHDTISVVAAYLAAYNAKRAGVTRYVAQYMFNSPAGMEPTMDLAKILAQIEMVESLHGPDFYSVRQTRTGLLHLSPRMNKAKGQLAASTVLQLAVNPHIIHVVGFCEGDHAASAEDVIESCEIVHGVLSIVSTVGEPLQQAIVQERKKELLADAEMVLSAIRELGDGEEDPFASPRVLSHAIRLGIMDAPHLRGNSAACGKIETRIIDGAVRAVDPTTKRVLGEAERLFGLRREREARTVGLVGGHAGCLCMPRTLTH